MKFKLIKYLIFIVVLFLGCNAFSISNFLIINDNFDRQELPITFVSKGLPTIEIKIKDQTYHLILDTGADSITIAFVPSAINRLKPEYLSEQKMFLDMNGNSYQQRQFELPQISIGNLRVKNLIGYEELRSFALEDGIIGNQFLKQFNVYFDYQNLKVVLYAVNTYPPALELAKWQKIYFDHNNIGIVLKGKLGLNKKELKFCLDSGMCCINNNKTYGLLKPGNIHGFFNKKNTYETDSFYIDGIDFGPIDFMVSDFKQPPVDGFLGHNFFSRYKVFIDFNKEILFILKNETIPAIGEM